jgi:hypothetical protein
MSRMATTASRPAAAVSTATAIASRSWTVPLLVLLLFLVHAAALILVFRPHLDDQAVNAYSPTRGDAFDYIARAERFASGQPFREVFADRYRMPGYPLFLAMFFALAERPLAAARYAQVVLSSSIIVLAYGVLRAAGLLALPALGRSLLFAVWFPFYYFAPILIPESLSLVLSAALLLVLARAAGRVSLAVAAVAALLVGLLVYLKPNHLLFLLPVLAFYGTQGLPWRSGSRMGAATIVITLAVLAPWLGLAAGGTGSLTGLTTAQGKNLYLGTGIATPPTGNTLPDRVAVLTKLYDPNAPQVMPGEASSELSSIHQARAVRTWRERPGPTILYGLAKIAHAFGFSLRGARDGLNAIFFLASLIACGALLRRRTHLPFASYYLAALLVVAVQAFFFLPNQRFKVVLVDFPALVLIALALAALPRWRAWLATREATA